MDSEDSDGAKTSRYPSGSSQRSVLVVVFTTILIDWVGFSVLIPVLPLYAERLGAGPMQIGLLLTVYALAQLFFLPVWGWVSDRVGRRPVILVSLFGTALSFGFLIQAESVEMIFAARALAGLEDSAKHGDVNRGAAQAVRAHWRIERLRSDPRGRRLAIAAHHHCVDRWVLLRAFQRRREGGLHGEGEGVALFGTVEANAGHARLAVVEDPGVFLHALPITHQGGFSRSRGFVSVPPRGVRRSRGPQRVRPGSVAR